MKTISSLINDGTLRAGLPQVIDMKPGEYLSDILARITDASEAKPYTINFYNHSKTVNWDKWNGLIQWPRWVYLNFVNVAWWPNNHYAGMMFDEGLVDVNPTDKLMLGFKFDRTNNDSYIQSSGLPNNLNAVYFGGLDGDYSEAGDYDTLIGDLANYGNGLLGLVYCKGSKDDNIGNSELYKKINGTLHKVTGNFSYCNLIGYNMTGSYLYGCNLYNANLENVNLYNANLQNANLQYANLQNANLQNASLQNASLYSANLQYANLYSASLQYASLQYASLYSANLDSANLDSANLQYANLQNANLDSANLYSASLQYASLNSANLQDILVNSSSVFRGANLTGVTGLPVDIDTKAKFIAAVGANNVNADTLWIDGTSILS